MELKELIGCTILILSGLTLLQFSSSFWHKVGTMLIWLSSGLGAYFFSGSVVMGCAVLSIWIFYPIWQMLFLLRQLRVPRHRELADARAPREDQDELSDMSAALKDIGFEVLDECHLKPADHEQYYRIFMRGDGLIQATIGYISQGAIGFHFMAFTANGKDGRRWITWDYPLTYGLVMPPNIAVYRALYCQDVADLYQAELDFLEINGVKEADLAPNEPTREAVRARLEETLNQQIEYNISRGYLAPVSGAESESFGYSWRGTLYVAGQVFRDLIS